MLRQLCRLEVRPERDKLEAVSNAMSSNAAPGMPQAPATSMSEPGARVERLFLPRPGANGRVATVLAALSCAALGAGVFGSWMAASPIAGSGPLLLGGLVLGGVAVWLAQRRPAPIRVGSLGVTVGDPTEAPRWAWCEMRRIGVEGEQLRIETSEAPLFIPLAAHGPAAARILAEAALRIPDRVEVSPRAQERVPPLVDGEGAIVIAGRLQIAGRKCLASGVSLTFESDARLCENCAALYHRQHAPAECMSCGRPLQAGALRPPGALAAGH
jgi:hypothetical protein